MPSPLSLLLKGGFLSFTKRRGDAIGNWRGCSIAIAITNGKMITLGLGFSAAVSLSGTWLNCHVGFGMNHV
jgi:hypothetical protein